MDIKQSYRLPAYVPGTAPVAVPAVQVPPQTAAMPAGRWDVDLPVPAPAPAPAPAPQPPAPPKVHKPRRGSDPRGAFKRLDGNDSEKLSRKEFRPAAKKGERFEHYDKNDDGKVTWREFLRTRLTKQSFERLDRNDDGKLKGREIERVISYAGVKYDRDGNGAVGKREFLQARERDEAALLKARRERNYENLSRKERKGRSFSEYERDAQQAANKRLNKRRSKIFEIADKNGNGELRGAELKRFRAYDKNDNGLSTKKEFMRGQRQDHQRAQNALRTEGRIGKPLAKRLWQDRVGGNLELPVWGIKLNATQVARILGSPVDAVRKNLPGIQKALEQAGITDRNTMIAALATIRTEVGSFQPIHEYGGPSYWARYNGRSDLGNRPGTNDGVKYHGRGYIQLTGRANYTNYGRRIGVNLAKHPNKALDPKVAAKVLIEYFEARGIPAMARRGDWSAVRRAVNGGYNGWDTFIGTVNRLRSNQGWFDKGWQK